METPALRIRLLGELELRLGSDPLPPLESARAESLLAYLLLHREAPQSRQHLAFLLWPDSSEGQARTNLRHLLHTLRHALPAPDRFLDVTPRTLQWRPDAPYWLDVAAFREAVARAATRRPTTSTHCGKPPPSIRATSLQGCYDEWLQAERETLRRAIWRFWSDSPRGWKPATPTPRPSPTANGSYATTPSTSRRTAS